MPPSGRGDPVNVVRVISAMVSSHEYTNLFNQNKLFNDILKDVSISHYYHQVEVPSTLMILYVQREILF